MNVKVAPAPLPQQKKTNVSSNKQSTQTTLNIKGTTTMINNKTMTASMSNTTNGNSGNNNKDGGVRDPTREENYLANVFAFGWGEDGRLGLGEVHEKNHPTPYPVMALHWKGEESQRVKAVACGGRHTLFVMHDQKGSVYSCGDSSQGALGWRSQKGDKGWTPQLVEGLKECPDRVVGVCAGHYTSFALTEVGEVWSWGSRQFGALGHGVDAGGKEGRQGGEDAGAGEGKQDVPKPVAGLAYIKVCQLSVMSYHVLALTADRRVYAWGRNNHGQLGIGKACRNVSTPIQVQFLRNERPVAVSAGGEHSVALVEVERHNRKRETVVYCWGNPANSRLGATDPAKHTLPQEHMKMTALQARKRIELKQIDAGGSHSLALTQAGLVYSWGADTGDLWGWGWNGFGELGMGEVKVKLQPYCLYGFKRAVVKGVYTGERHTVVLTEGIATKVSDDDAYRPYFQLMDENHGNNAVKDKVRRSMAGERLNPTYLDHRNALLPGQPGMADECVEIDEQKYGYKWCFETWGKDTFMGRSCWPTRHRCELCHLKQVCMPCARHCHKGHGTEPYIAAKQKGDKCDCSGGERASSCVCRWSELRQEFDRLAQPDGEYIKGPQLRPLLDIVRYGKSFTVEDLEAAYQCLCFGDSSAFFGEADPISLIESARIEWFVFEEWYVDYFAAKDAPPVSLEDMMMMVASSGDKARASVTGGGDNKGGEAARRRSSS